MSMICPVCGFTLKNSLLISMICPVCGFTEKGFAVGILVMSLAPAPVGTGTGIGMGTGTTPARGGEFLLELMKYELSGDVMKCE